ncbi:MAG: TetR/AcrR family transcriptional regulator [Proteobacteria bacterium]|nr:TetR/AcrR family transcriptional regulator [Pseudomonadota bacterium]
MGSKKTDSTRKNLLKAGISVFAEKGYKETTVREICKQAGSANINSINYYFGSKELLYREILELIFSKYDEYKSAVPEKKSPEQQLKDFITNFCIMLYKDNAFASDVTKIFVSEMTKPSPFIEELVDQYNKPRLKKHLKMIRDILGEDAPDYMVRDCLVSVSGQLLYFSFAWPVFNRLFPEHSPGDTYEQWADHVFNFSMGGINACRKQLQELKKGG